MVADRAAVADHDAVVDDDVRAEGHAARPRWRRAEDESGGARDIGHERRSLADRGNDPPPACPSP